MIGFAIVRIKNLSSTSVILFNLGAKPGWRFAFAAPSQSRRTLWSS